MLNSEVSRVAGVFEFLRAPFRFSRRWRPLGDRPALRRRSTFRPSAAAHGARLTRPLWRWPRRLLATRLATRLALLLGVAHGSRPTLSCRTGRRLAALLLTAVIFCAATGRITLSLLTLSLLTLSLLTLSLFTLSLLTLSLLTLFLLTLFLLTLSLLTLSVRTAACLATGRLRAVTARRAALLATGFSVGSRTWR